MKETWQIVLAGEGGQGLIVAGIILAEAASIFEGKFAIQTQSYGIATRGGSSSAEVVISEKEIIYESVEEPDLVLALTTDAYEQYAGALDKNAVLIYDAGLVDTTKIEKVTAKTYGIPFTDLARELGKVTVANIVSLGTIARLSDAVKIDSMEKAVLKRFGGSAAELNKKAFRLGIEFAENDSMQ
ncbi:NADH-dependent phenylglyoxylate dehydrogenase subunit gamma [Pelotomaculum schinkii]|uniref:NADH-dependent phenylglyoxylate dehydrogenase subunit gamma n=1 Tax=Pelotomaculum schinkii TaxID=78350 RepID=A0A4Y7R676_9FIRM|nr:2-oxoacid:acceptor oxidoreductase family protein [Pelotomaculum schinkii]TEB04464.1 NADH-dependent phenylglyoxylate dehydrogenase subunit gamma [Pelotomaculum schinkii]